MLDRLKELLGQLPEQNQLTLARLMYHLHRFVMGWTVRVQGTEVGDGGVGLFVSHLHVLKLHQLPDALTILYWG